jgi:signal transduction histidine kinase
LLSRRISRPVSQLTLAADAMAAGALEQSVEGAGSDEIGRLVQSFNSMSSRVAATDRSQRDLLANVAHELRTPLTNVQGYAKALQDHVIGDEAGQHSALNVIGRESERMNRLIAELLDLARLESGQSALAFRPVFVSSLGEQLIERFQAQASQRQIVFSVSMPPELTLSGDASRLVQLLSNLVSNALRHTPAGGLVSVSACAVDRIASGAPGVRVIVHDTGTGIAAELLPRIFERFTRGEEPDRTGFGLGLAIAKEIVDLHHGFIAVHSEPGNGATFTIDLPAAG